MAKDPAFLFYTSDFLSGVVDLTMEERGQYITLLCLQHQKGFLNEKTIRLCVGSVSVDVMSKFKQSEDGNYYNERLLEEVEKRKFFIDSRRENGLKGGRPKASDKPSGYPNAEASEIPNGEPKKNLRENENENENIDDLKGDERGKKINISFDDFWNLYDKKVGDKQKLIKKWEDLKDKERELIMAHIPKYKISQPDKKYRKDPQTYLNNKSWNDEIILPNNGQNITQRQKTPYELELEQKRLQAANRTPEYS
jgi:hypothetical protein